MKLDTRVRRLLRARRAASHRRVWACEHRAHLQLRHMQPFETARFGERIERALEEIPHVRWARVNAALRRVVVELEPEQVTVEMLVARLDEVERRLAIDRRPLAADAPPYPGGADAIRRILVEMASDVLSWSVGLERRLRGKSTLPIEFDLAAIISAIEGIPRLRRSLEYRLTSGIAELGIELSKASLQAMLQSELGPVVGVLSHALRLREERANGRVWSERESELCGAPARHACERISVGPRPRPLPPGPIERYTSRAVPASLAAFGLSLASTRHFERASAAIFAGIPKPAELGREAFAAHLGALLARRGVLVLDSRALRRLDRIDAIVIDGDRLVDGAAAAHALVTDARAAGLRLAVVAADRAAAWAAPDEWIAPDQRNAAVRSLQRRGHGVMAIGAPTEAADVAVALTGEDAAPPWGAHAIAHTDLEEARLFVRATPAARRASRQSVDLAVIEAATAVVLSFSSGLKRRTVRRIMAAANTASIAAMANGIRNAHPVAAPAGPPRRDETPWHALDREIALRRIGSSAAGLSSTEAIARRRPPQPEPSAAASFAQMVVEELANPMAPVLAAGAGLSALVGSVADAGLIATVIAINGLVGGVQRYRTEKAVSRLDRSEPTRVRVRRDGRLVEVDDQELVVGDVIELRAGDVVPADCRILDLSALEVDESSLTGESLPVEKSPEPSRARAVADRTSMLYEGTTVAAGSAVAVVVAVDGDTEAQRALAEDGGAPPVSGVEARLDALTAFTAPVAAASGLAVTASGFARKLPFRDIVSAGVSLAVAAVPEGLPLLATLAQLSAARRLSQHGALVRNPRAVEALGRVSVLCADKTGTLTEGRIQLRLVSDGAVAEAASALDDAHREILSIAVRATPSARGSGGGPLPHVTDQALIDGARRAGVTSHDGLLGWERVGELPFEPRRGFHAGLARHAGGRLLSAKGAPEVILPRCTRWRRNGRSGELDARGREALLGASIALARRGLRVLAVAERGADGEDEVDDEAVTALAFCGFVGLADPVRLSAKAAVDDLRRAGVEVVMVTGDHPSTADAIATELGLLNGGEVVTGPEIDDLDDAALDARIAGVSVFARVTPTQKVRIVRSLQRVGKVVAMTGDGANDAPAIRLADVGIALGEGATAAARHAADLVVTDGQIETIVRAALEGRALWTSVRDAVSILVGGNLGEIAFTVVGGLLAGRSPLGARQLLLVNLLTDTLPAMAIALRPPHRATPEQLLREGPDVSLADALTRDIVWRAVVTAGAAAGAWMMARATGTRARASTVSMLALTGAQLGQTLVIGGRSAPVLATGIGSLAGLVGVVETPGLSQFFGCRPLGPLGLFQAGVATAIATGASVAVPRLARAVAERVGVPAPLSRWRQRVESGVRAAVRRGGAVLERAQRQSPARATPYGPAQFSGLAGGAFGG